MCKYTSKNTGTCILGWNPWYPDVLPVSRGSEKQEWVSALSSDAPLPHPIHSLQSCPYPRAMPPPPPPGSWLQLWESLLVLGLGDERLCRPSWTVSKGGWILSRPASTDTDLLSPLSARLMLLLEQQLTAGGTSGCSSRLMCLFQDPLSCALVPPLPLLLPCSCCLSLHTSIPKPRLSTTPPSSVPAPKPMSSVLGDASADAGFGELVKLTWFGERVGGNLERSGNPPSLTPPHPPLLMLLGVRMGGGLPTASSVTLSGLVAWAWGYRWL